jgi:spoIIIJ-associated protein
MLSQPDLETIKEITKDFFEKATFEVEMEFLSQEDLTLPISLNVQDPQILIGEGGQTLNEIQHLLKAILKRKVKEPFYIDLDINGYKKKKNEYLKEIARSIADEVSLTKKERALSPMPAHERRVVHLELSERTDIVTESIGQEPERKVVVKPCS